MVAIVLSGESGIRRDIVVTHVTEVNVTKRHNDINLRLILGAWRVCWRREGFFANPGLGHSCFASFSRLILIE